jgi:hypothetical protein
MIACLRARRREVVILDHSNFTKVLFSKVAMGIDAENRLNL